MNRFTIAGLSRTRAIAIAALSVVLCASRAHAGFDVELGAESAYSYDGTVCTSTGTHAGRTVPHCTGASNGHFWLRGFTWTLGSVPEVGVARVSFVPRGTIGSSPQYATFLVQCTAITTGASIATINFAAGETVQKDIAGGGATCAQDAECAYTGAPANPGAIRNQSTSADCASTDCNNTELICQVSYGGGYANAYTTGLDVSSIKLTLTP